MILLLLNDENNHEFHVWPYAVQLQGAVPAWRIMLHPTFSLHLG